MKKIRVFDNFKCPYEKKSGNLSYAPRICSPTGVEHCGKGISYCHSHNTKLFDWIEHSGIKKGKNVNE